MIRKHNQENNNSYLGINKFADISTGELKNLYLCGKNEIKNHTDVYELETNLNLASNVTRGLRALLMLSRIKGWGCSSGSAFAATGAIESMWKISGKALLSLANSS